jgi:ubiquitin carboxyl-terminal hydrolase 48
MKTPVLTRNPFPMRVPSLHPIQISKLFDIPTICQKLTLHGTELLDNEATAESLDILADDVLELQQITEEIDIDSDGAEETRRSRSKPREEGQGFNGTVLGGQGSMLTLTDYSLPSSRADTPADILISEPGGGVAVAEEEKSCRVCTYSNKPNVSACEICDTIFE